MLLGLGFRVKGLSHGLRASDSPAKKMIQTTAKTPGPSALEAAGPSFHQALDCP